MESIFRQEALNDKASHVTGRIGITQPISSWLVTVVALAIFLSTILFLYVGTMNSKARISGLVVPSGGLINVTAFESGTVAKILKQEGDAVAAGEPIFELVTERRFEGKGITALVGAQLSIRKTHLETEEHIRDAAFRNQRRVLRDKVESLTREDRHLDEEILSAQRLHELAEKSLHKYRVLQDDGFVSSLQVEQKEQAAIELEARISDLKRTKLQLNTQRISAQAELSDATVEFNMAKLRLQSNESALVQDMAENETRGGNFVTSQYAGRIGGISISKGTSVIPGQAMATIIPADGSELEAHFYAPSRLIGFITRGQQVLLRYDAFPYEKYGLQHGQVSDISLAPFSSAELPAGFAGTVPLTIANNSSLARGSGSESLYRIKVKLSSQTVLVRGTAKQLRAGMTVAADVIQEKRRIWEWIAAPILAAQTRS